jgi:hypothetical protein
VNCRDVDNLLLSHASGAPISPEAAGHIAACDRCRPLARALAERVDTPPPSSDRLRSIEAALLADLKPVKPVLPANLFSLILIGALLLVAVAGVAVLGLDGWRVLSLGQRITVFSALAAAAGLLASSLARQAVPGRKLLLPPYGLLAGIWVSMAAILAGLFQPHWEATFVATGLVCLEIGVGCAIPAGLLFRLALRRGAILDSRRAGATAGALAGLSGLLVLEIICPNLNRYHILVWHVGAVVVSIAAGFWLAALADRARQNRREK